MCLYVLVSPQTKAFEAAGDLLKVLAAPARLEILNRQMGVWRCRTAFNCVEACPREINITKAIAEVKNALVTGQV